MAQKHEALAITDADLPDNFTAHLDQISVRRPPEHVVAEAREAARRRGILREPAAPLLRAP